MFWHVKEHRTRLQEVEQESKERHDQAFRELAAKPEAQGIRLVRTPAGFALAPLKDGPVLGPDEFEKLTRAAPDRRLAGHPGPPPMGPSPERRRTGAKRGSPGSPSLPCAAGRDGRIAFVRRYPPCATSPTTRFRTHAGRGSSVSGRVAQLAEQVTLNH